MGGCCQGYVRYCSWNVPCAERCRGRSYIAEWFYSSIMPFPHHEMPSTAPIPNARARCDNASNPSCTIVKGSKSPATASNDANHSAKEVGKGAIGVRPSHKAWSILRLRRLIINRADNRTLAKLTRVNKGVFRNVVPVLYRSIEDLNRMHTLLAGVDDIVSTISSAC